MTRKRRAPLPAYCVAGHEWPKPQSGRSRSAPFPLQALRSQISLIPALKRAITGSPNHPSPPRAPCLFVQTTNMNIHVQIMCLLHSGHRPWKPGRNYLSSDAPSNFVRDP